MMKTETISPAETISSAETSSVVIRRIKEEDVDSVKLLYRSIQKNAARDEILIHLRRFLVHLYLRIVILFAFFAFYFVFQLSFAESIFTSISLVTLTEGVRFYFFWKKIRIVFSEGTDLSNLLQFYSHPKRCFLVAVVDGVLAGTVAIRETDQPQTAKLFRMFVHPGFRRMGIASRLIVACIRECKTLGYTYVSLRTHLGNEKAVKCYLKAGFSFVEEQRFAQLYPHRFDTGNFIKNILQCEREDF